MFFENMGLGKKNFFLKKGDVWLLIFGGFVHDTRNKCQKNYFFHFLLTSMEEMTRFLAQYTLPTVNYPYTAGPSPDNCLQCM